MFDFFKKIKKNTKERIKEKEKFGESILLCPRCEKGMDKIKRNNVIIDTCRKCGGIWLDDKEIDKLSEMRPEEITKDKPFKKKKNTKHGGKD